jgi:hypothetical protein
MTSTTVRFAILTAVSTLALASPAWALRIHVDAPGEDRDWDGAPRDKHWGDRDFDRAKDCDDDFGRPHHVRFRPERGDHPFEGHHSGKGGHHGRGPRPGDDGIPGHAGEHGHGHFEHGNGHGWGHCKHGKGKGWGHAGDKCGTDAPEAPAAVLMGALLGALSLVRRRRS